MTWTPRRLAFCLAVGLAVPTPAASQLGIAARAGTLGVGGEAAVGLGDRVVLRGGVGLSLIEPSTTFDGVRVDLALPERWSNVGIDLYLNSALRIGGGVLFKSEDPTLTATLEEPVDIGGRTFSPAELGSLVGTVQGSDRAGYALIGFGKHTASGFGLFLDLGLAFLGDPEVDLDASGGTFSDLVELEARLEQEAQDFEDDMKTYLRFWPILSLGLRLGFG